MTMTCDSAIEFLPWLLNGTLAAGERDELWHHLKTCERCRQALAETREAWSVFAQHLPSADLVGLAWGETPSGTVEEHLASCPQCAAELELARMSRRLEQEENVAIFPSAKPRPAAGAAPRSWRAVAMAAGLTAAVAAGGWFLEARKASEFSTQLAQRTPAVPASPAGDSSLKEQISALVNQLGRLQDLQKENEKKATDAQAQVAQLEAEREGLAKPQAVAMLELSGDVVRGEEAAEQTVRGDQYMTLLLPARGAKSGEKRAEIVN